MNAGVSTRPQEEGHTLGRRAADKVGGRPRVREYLVALTASFFGPRPVQAAECVPVDQLPDRLFDVLVRREFCYLSKRRVAPYYADFLRWVRPAVAQAAPIEFYYDIGGGYHASLRPSSEPVSFDVGLAEIFLLRQIRKFAMRAGAIYAPGVRFHLVVDNLCAHLINDIPVERTLGYCRALRELVEATAMADCVDLLVESEHVDAGDFERIRLQDRIHEEQTQVTLAQHRNVERFLGRPCEESEALQRCIRYREVCAASEALLAPLIKGFHLTQRATASTMCFRAYPGGDSRIQSGEVALRSDAGWQLGPILLTSANVEEYLCYRDRPMEVLPKVVNHVTYAIPI